VGSRSLKREITLRVLFYFIVGSFVDGLLLIAGAQRPMVWVLAPIAAAGIITSSGEILLRTFSLRLETGWLPAAFVAGLTITSVAMMVPTILWSWSAQSAFLAWSALVLAGVTLSRRFPNAAPPITAIDLPVMFGMALFVGFFARHQVAALPVLQDTGKFPAWIDYFIHGTVIASFGDPLAIGIGDVMLPGVPRSFYHYAAFMLPAALSEATGLAGLGLATAILLPVGLLTGLSGLYVLAVELGGIGLGLLAIWFVACVPDASHYGLQNGLFGFLWLIFAAPGSAYAIGLAALAWTSGLRWFRERKFKLLLLSFLFTLLIIPVRAHMFILLAPVLTGTIALSLLRRRLRTQLLVASAIVGAALTVLLCAGFFDRHGAELLRPADYVAIAFAQGPPSYAELLKHLAEQYGQATATLIGGLLLLPATLGLWSLFFPAVVLWEALRGRFRPEDYFPLFLCLTYLALIFWAPIASNGDLTEYKQRHFVLLYALVLLCTVVRLGSLTGLSTRISRLSPAAAAGLVGAIAFATMLVCVHVDVAQPSRTMTWTEHFYAVQVEPGIPEAASYMRGHKRQGDMIAAGGTGAHASLWGAAVELSSLTDMPVYVGRIDQYVATREQSVVELVKARAAQVAAIDASTDRATALRTLRSYGVRWYVIEAPELPAWDRSGATATYRAGSIFIYDARGDASSNEEAQ